MDHGSDHRDQESNGKAFHTAIPPSAPSTCVDVVTEHPTASSASQVCCLICLTNSAIKVTGVDAYQVTFCSDGWRWRCRPTIDSIEPSRLRYFACCVFSDGISVVQEINIASDIVSIDSLKVVRTRGADAYRRIRIVARV